MSRYFRQAVKKAMLPTIRPHDLRHTHATLALQAGIHPKVVSERLGHANVSITLDTYSHAIPAHAGGGGGADRGAGVRRQVVPGVQPCRRTLGKRPSLSGGPTRMRSMTAERQWPYRSPLCRRLMRLPSGSTNVAKVPPTR